MKKASVVLLALLVLIAGCTSGFRRSEEIHVYGYAADSAAGMEFARLYGAEGNETMQEVADAQAMTAAIAADPYAIGYGPASAADDPAVRQLAVVAQADAPVISREIWLVKLEDADNGSLETNFYEFIISSVGQQMMAEEGYSACVEKPLPICGACYKPPGTIRVAVSETLMPMMEALRDRYYGYNKQADIQLIIMEGGAQPVAEEEVQIAFYYGEGGQEDFLEYTLAATVDYALLVNAENPLEELNEAEIAKIFSGEMLAWKEIGQ